MEIRIEPSLVDLRIELNRTALCARRYADRILVYTRPRQASPETAAQREGRMTMRRAGEAWRSLPPQVQQAWHEFAGRISRADANRRTRVTRGYSLYLQATSNRLMLGLAPPREAPLIGPPPAPSALTLMACADPRRFEFVVDRVTGLESGQRVATRISQATAGPGRAPQSHLCRLIHGFSEASAPPLPAAGQPIVFEGARYAVYPGQRFGIAVRLFRESDGLYSPELFCDLVRQ